MKKQKKPLSISLTPDFSLSQIRVLRPSQVQESKILCVFLSFVFIVKNNPKIFLQVLKVRFLYRYFKTERHLKSN